MIRRAFVMHVNPGQHEEYERRHTPIWSELHAAIKAHGVHNYSIFLHKETSQLFSYVELESEEQWNTIAQEPACQRWWKHMKEIMPSNPDDSPKSVELHEVFHID